MTCWTKQEWLRTLGLCYGYSMGRYALWVVTGLALLMAAEAHAALSGRLPSDVRQIVFAMRKPAADGHWYANFGYYADEQQRPAYVPGGRLCVLDVQTGNVRRLLDDPEGGVRDPVVDYDGSTILFSYRPGKSTHFHLYTIQANGTGLRRLTQGDYDDIEPCWLPDGQIMFVSSRCRRWVNCWLTQVATLYRCKRDGSGIERVSGNIEQDNTPWVLSDGRVIYQRWEYIDRSQVHYHHLWAMNPDGTGQMVFFGNEHPGTVMIDSKPIPDSNRIVAVFSPGHGRREHDGAIAIVDPEAGPDDLTKVTILQSKPVFRDPYPLGSGYFLAARENGLVLLDDQGRIDQLYALPTTDRKAGYQCHEPRPLVARTREPIISSRTSKNEPSGTLVLADVYRGRNMSGVQRGEVKQLLVIESLPKPINFTGGMDPLSYGGTFTLERVLGTVPVESDGSACFKVPARRSLFFVALDEKGMSVKRMQSFLSVQPGEVTGCVGCHERRSETPAVQFGNLAALRRPPSRIKPMDDLPDVFDFPRDIQPILNRLCMDCHGYDKTARGGPYAGKLILSGDHGPMFSHSYYEMTVKQLFSDGRNRPVSNRAPRTIGSSASRVLTLLDGSHYGVRATERQRTILRLWIETGAPYPGTYAALGTGMIGGYAQNRLVNTDTDWPTTRAAAKVIQRRCGHCHTGNRVLPKSLSDERGVSFWNFDLQDPRLRMSRHIVFNLSRPNRSLMLLAPLATHAGGYQICGKANQRQAVFETVEDSDYQKLLSMIQAGQRELERIKRFDMPGFQPRGAYIREMKRYGVLPADLPAKTLLNPYTVDRAYWRMTQEY